MRVGPASSRAEHDGTAASYHALGTRARAEEVQRRLDANPNAMRQRRETVEHASARSRRGWVRHTFLMKRLPRVATDMALHVLAYHFTRTLNIVGIGP
jgi:hypothetical protein